MPQSISPHQYARRLQRLLMIINEIKTTPHQAPEALYTSLGISRAMFYKDCQVLKALGLAFHYDRPQRRYIITQDRYLPVLDLSTRCPFRKSLVSFFLDTGSHVRAC